ncbi:MAG: LPS assembly lipoprotein LptE [Verrucomicrobiota bacterium]
MRQTLIIFTLLGAWLLGGCSNYQLGDRVEMPFKSVYVAPIINRSFAPQAEVILANQVIEDLNRSGQVKTGDKYSDVSLKIILIDYQRGVTATRPQDTQVARAYNLTLTAQVTLINNKTGEVYIERREISTSQQAFTEGGFIQSEYQAMPVLTRKLAQEITEQVLGAW